MLIIVHIIHNTILLLFCVEALPEISKPIIIAISQYKRISGVSDEMLHKNLDILLCMLYNANRKLNCEIRKTKNAPPKVKFQGRESFYYSNIEL